MYWQENKMSTSGHIVKSSQGQITMWQGVCATAAHKVAHLQTKLEKMFFQTHDSLYIHFINFM